MRIETHVMGSLGVNTYILRGPEGNIVVDPGGTPEETARLAGTIGGPVAILITHCHADHIAGVDDLRRATGARVYAPAIEETWFSDPELNLSGVFGAPFSLKPPDDTLSGGERIRLSGIEIEVLFVPGHTPGHLVYRLGSDVITGDTIFSGSIGRTDLPGGSLDLLLKAIRREILSLPGGTRVHPGHGPSTTVETERRQNPFLT